jgi:hypothetical protein
MFAVGTSTVRGFEDGYIVNFNYETGTIQGQLLLGRDFYDDGRFFTVTNNGIIFGGVAGSIGGPNRSNIYLAQLIPVNDSTIQFGWQKNYGGDTATNFGFLAADTAGNVIVAGDKVLPGAQEDEIVFKVNTADGSVMWGKSFGSSVGDYISDGALLPDGSIAIVGATDDGANPSNVFAARLGSNGELCDGNDIFIEARDQSDSLLGPVIPFLRDSAVNYTKNDYYQDSTGHSVTSNDYCMSTPVKQVASKDNSIKIYPNPTSGKLFVESTGWKDNVKVNVYNMIGTQVFTRTVDAGTQQFSIDLSNSPKGMYIISFNDGSTITTEKVSLN